MRLVILASFGSALVRTSILIDGMLEISIAALAVTPASTSEYSEPIDKSAIDHFFEGIDRQRLTEQVPLKLSATII